MLEKDGGDHLDRTCEKLRSTIKSYGAKKYSTTIKKRKDKWIGHILGKKRHLEHVIEGKVDGRT